MEDNHPGGWSDSEPLAVKNFALVITSVAAVRAIDPGHGLQLADRLKADLGFAARLSGFCPRENQIAL